MLQFLVPFVSMISGSILYADPAPVQAKDFLAHPVGKVLVMRYLEPAGVSALSLECPKDSSECWATRKKDGKILVQKMVLWEAVAENFSSIPMPTGVAEPEGKGAAKRVVLQWSLAYGAAVASGKVGSGPDDKLPVPVALWSARLSELTGW